MSTPRQSLNERNTASRIMKLVHTSSSINYKNIVINRRRRVPIIIQEKFANIATPPADNSRPASAATTTNCKQKNSKETAVKSSRVDNESKATPVPSAAELSEDDIEFLVANTGFDVTHIKRWHDEFALKCPSGHITYRQFRACYKALMPAGMNERAKHALAKKLFDLFDIDGDGELNFSEFLVSFWIRCKAPMREKYTWIFNMLDVDRNGCLSYGELRNAMSMCLNLGELDRLLEELGDAVSCKSTSSQSFTQFEHNSNNNNNNNYMSSSSSSSSTSSSPSSQSSQSSSAVAASLANKKYNVYSRTSDLIHDKLHQTILMLAIGGEKATAAAAAHSRQLKKSASSRMSMSSLDSAGTSLDDDSELLGGVLGDHASHSVTNSSSSSSSSCNIDMQIRQVQMSREVFLDYCDQFKTFRKLIMPIKSFHDDE